LVVLGKSSDGSGDLSSLCCREMTAAKNFIYERLLRCTNLEIRRACVE